MAYPTVAQLVGASSNEALLALPEAQQEELRLAAIAAVEEFTGQSFDSETDTTRVLDGPGSTVLYLPKRLETLISLEVSGSALTATEVVLSPDRDRLTVKPRGGLGWGYYEWTLWELDDRPPLSFVYGDNTITIRGDWGWPEVPAPVVTAIRKDMEDTASADANLLAPSVAQFRRLGLRDISQGNLRAAISDATGLSPVVERLLGPYVWTGPVGVMV